jgi:hypothetical protein
LIETIIDIFRKYHPFNLDTKLDILKYFLTFTNSDMLVSKVMDTFASIKMKKSLNLRVLHQLEEEIE